MTAPKVLRALAGALLIVAVAWALRELLAPWISDRTPFLTFYPAVVVAALLFRLPGGLTAVLATALISDLMVFAPAGRFAMDDPRDLTALGIFALNGVVISVLSEAVHRHRERAQRAEGAQRQAALATQLRGALSAANAGTWEWSLGSSTIPWSEETWRLLGLNRDQPLTVETWLTLVRPQEREGLRAQLAQDVEAGRELSFEWQSADPGDRWLLARGRPERNGLGEVVRYVGLVFDISQRRTEELVLAAREGQFRRAIEASPFPSMLFDDHGDVLAVSEAWLEITGYTREELPTIRAWTRRAFGENHLFVLQTILSHFDNEGRNFAGELLVTCRDGSTRIWDFGYVHLTPILNGRRTVMSVATDVTDRRTAETALRESEYFFRESQRAAAIGSYKTDFPADRWDSSEVLDEIFGIGAGYVRSVAGWLELVHPDDKEMMRSHLQDEVIALGHRFSKEYRVVRPDGETRWVHGLGEMTFGADGTPVSLTGTIQDITERKRGEQERELLQGQLLQSQKMESLGVLAGGVAHDMNNVLAAILTTASTKMLTLNRDDTSYRAFEKIALAAGRGGRTVKGLLSFARKSPSERREFQLNALIEESAGLLERTIPAHVTVTTDLDPLLPLLVGDADAMMNLLMNLCVNAVDAMPEAGTLTVRTRWLAPNEVSLEVNDTGLGMPPEVLENALNPFFTTKPVGKGTGLGLSVVFNTVRAHGGQLELASSVGIGTTVTIRFPTVDQPKAAASESACEDLERALHVLVVDDDELVRESLREILEALCHSVTTAPSGEEAQNQLERGLRPDVLILDMNMPGLSGAQTLPLVRTLLPGLPVLLSTGRTDHAAVALAEAHPKVTLLPKPFELSALKRALAEVAGGA